MQKNIIFTVFILLTIGVMASFFLVKNENYTNRSENQPDSFGVEEDEQEESSLEDEIKISSPLQGEVVNSPVYISGQARGSWFFEGSFPVKIVDSDRNVLGSGSMGAEDEWMTEAFVPFSGSISYKAQENKNGYVIFEKANPSGLSKNSKIVEIPVNFTESEGMMIEVYFPNSKMGSDDQCEKVFPVNRNISETPQVARAALQELFEGPTKQENDEGFFTSINEGVEILEISIEDGMAEVNLSKEVENEVGGSCRVLSIRAQIEETLSQFESVDFVEIMVEGESEGVLQP